MQIRRTLPLLVTGTVGVGLLGFGLTGLSSVDPQLRTAQQTWEHQQQTALMQQVNCDPEQVRTTPAPPEV